jgi:hypothetical protein
MYYMAMMLAADTVRTLAGKHAWDPTVLIDLGIPAETVMTMIADGPRAVPERPRLNLDGRRRGDRTTCYVWGPDIPVFLGTR